RDTTTAGTRVRRQQVLSLLLRPGTGRGPVLIKSGRTVDLVRLLFVGEQTGGRGARLGTADVAEAFANHVSPEQIAFFSAELFRETLLQMGWLSDDEKFVHQPSLDVWEEPQIDAQPHERQQV